MANGARKYDNDKAPVTTGVFWRFPRALMEVAKVSKLGADKYEVVLPDNNCLNVENGFNRYADADGRHLLQRAIEVMNTEKGGALPPEGVQIRHLAQHAWDALCILEMELIEAEKVKTTELDLQGPWHTMQMHMNSNASDLGIGTYEVEQTSTGTTWRIENPDLWEKYLEWMRSQKLSPREETDPQPQLPGDEPLSQPTLDPQ